ncbi:DUF305 domain-containing protein [Georgenia sp. AZ-5]|uniref:DUF305 domain-containing protein n=1 Tax=Georgenia sp. AZ-5 TaxID=3367526 RepID=UPI00375537EE
MKLKTRLTSASGAVVLALVLAGCGTGEEAAEPGDTTAETTAAQETTTAESTGGEVDEQHNDADTMFAQMMIVHHKGAIEMADLAVEKAESEEVRNLAEGISAAQGPEIEQMTSWLEVWGEDTSGDTGHMDHGGMDMGGMSQEEAMAELEGLSGTEFDRRFLELMIEHHKGAVEMAQTELADGENPQALELAQKIIGDQQAEITQMEQMLQSL